MAIIRTYNLADFPYVIDFPGLDEKIRTSGCVDNFQGINETAKNFEILGETINDEVALDAIMSDYLGTPLDAYAERNKARQLTLENATISMVGYYMALGDDKATADGKVTQISNEVRAELFPYVLGNKSALVDALNAITSLAFFDEAAKTYLIGLL